MISAVVVALLCAVHGYALPRHARPSLSHTRPYSSDTRPSSSRTRPASSHARPASSHAWPASSHARPASSHARPTPRAPPAACSLRETFTVAVDLGDGVKLAEELVPLFSESDIVTVRYPLPFELAAEAEHGVMRVTRDGNGLLTGDVLRLCSTFTMRMDAVGGLLPMGTKPTKCLFLADGQPPQRVVEALTANTDDRTEDVWMAFERPVEPT